MPSCRRLKGGTRGVRNGLIVPMKLHSDPHLPFIDLSERPSVESREVSEGVVLDYDSSGRLMGIDIDNAANKVEL
jgi:uncharacterized protein YuzE